MIAIVDITNKTIHKNNLNPLIEWISSSQLLIGDRALIEHQIHFFYENRFKAVYFVGGQGEAISKQLPEMSNRWGIPIQFIPNVTDIQQLNVWDIHNIHNGLLLCPQLFCPVNQQALPQFNKSTKEALTIVEAWNGTEETEVFRIIPQQVITKPNRKTTLKDLMQKSGQAGKVVRINNQGVCPIVLRELNHYIRQNKQAVKKNTQGAHLEATGQHRQEALIGKNCAIGEAATIQSSVLGDNVIVGNRTKVINSVVYSNTRLGKNIFIQDAIVCQNKIYCIKTGAVVRFKDPQIIEGIQDKSSWNELKRWAQKIITRKGHNK